MPEETTEPSEPKKRRPAKAQEESGGKMLPIILVVVILGLGFALYKRNASAGDQAEADAKSITTLSNQVSEVRTKMALEQSDIGVAQSNHLAVLSRRTADVLNFSNLLVQTRQRLEDKQHEATTAHGEVSSKAASLALLEAQRDELQRQAALVPRLQTDVADLKDKLNGMYAAQATMHDMLGRARLEVADLERKLSDPLFLRRQERRVMETTDVRQKAAAKERIDTSDPHVWLELQPDGTVRPAMTTSAQPRK